MSTVTINFIGVCTHLNDIPMTPPDDALSSGPSDGGHYSSVVAVNSRFGALVGGNSIPPHVQHLHIPSKFIAKQGEAPGLVPISRPGDDAWWSMDGVQLYIANANPGLTKTDSFKKIPGLRDISGELSLKLDERVVLDGRAACQFAIYGGELDAYHAPDAANAIVAKLTVTTPDAEPRLIVTRVWDQTRSIIQLKDGAYVYVFNIGQQSDQETDFLLHYFVTTWTPPIGIEFQLPAPQVRLIREDDGWQHMGQPPGGLTLGCSNSNYP
jgi:hypothetical protein